LIHPFCLPDWVDFYNRAISTDKFLHLYNYPNWSNFDFSKITRKSKLSCNQIFPRTLRFSKQHFDNCMRSFYVLFLVLFLGKILTAQSLSGRSNLREKTIDATQKVHRLDSLTIDPQSFSLTDSATGKSILRDFYYFKNGTLIIDNERVMSVFPETKRLRARWRTFPFDFEKNYARLDSTKIRRSENGTAIAYDFTPFESKKDIFDSENGVKYAGNYTRGFSLGNAQNLAFNSNLNLQMDGKIGDDLTIRAAISDNSIPIQPEGTTRQIQEFDRIFIQISKKNASLLAGDFDLGTRQTTSVGQFATASSQHSTGYFTRFYKKIQGAAIDFQSPKILKNRSDSLQIQAAIGVAKGKFSRQILRVNEGNQGPYRLQGAENEQFIIVLAGSERVFLDGQLMRRGLEDDFVIDYNLGEIQFTNRRLITAVSRVIVEFEYADQDFLRSTMAVSSQFSMKRARIFTNLYSEQDSRSGGSLQNLSPSERQTLQAAGDKIALGSGVDTASFAADRVLYKLVDSTVCGQFLDSILVWSTNSDSARFSAKFSEVGFGNGDYILVQSSANGRVFRWVSPDPVSCFRRGNYAPVIRLAAPQQLQIWSLGADYQLVKYGKFSTELAGSRRDRNRFSNLDSGDDLGAAVFSSWQKNVYLGEKTSGWQLSTRVGHELKTTNFEAINPYRSAEFARDWNVGTSIQKATENLASAAVSIRKPKIGSLGYAFSIFDRSKIYAGQRHSGDLFIEKNGWRLRSDASFLKSKGVFEQTKFFRPRLDLSKSIKKKGAKNEAIRVGFFGEHERNERHPTAQVDSLTRSSFAYQLGKIYVEIPVESGKFRFGSGYQIREDFGSNGEFFKKNTRANDLTINGLWQIFKQNQLDWNLTARNLSVLDSTLTTLKSQRTYLGRTGYVFSFFRNAISGNSGYEIGSGQEAKILYIYQKTDPGLGQFFWNDRNEDGLISADEIETPAFTDQANVLRVILPTNDFVRTNNVSFLQSLRLEPRAAWAKPTKKQRFLGRFSTQTEWQILRKVRANAPEVSAWNPFQLQNLPDSILVTVNSGLRNVFFINRSNPIWDFQIEQKDNRSQLNLASGFEKRRTAEFGSRGRITFHKKWTLILQAAKGQKASDAQLFAGRDYRVVYRFLQPNLSWQPSSKWRTSVRGRFQKSANSLIISGEHSDQTDFSTEMTGSFSKQKDGWIAASRLNARVTFSQINYSGMAGTALAFTMLEGLQPGQNWIWNFTFDRQLSRWISLNLSYEGRKTGVFRVVHVGRMQVRANF
jgi:hypothetical protein